MSLARTFILAEVDAYGLDLTPVGGPSGAIRPPNGEATNAGHGPFVGHWRGVYGVGIDRLIQVHWGGGNPGVSIKFIPPSPAS